MIKVIKPGFFTSVQDHGRFGYRNIGIPYSGFMDYHNASLANSIVGNHLNESLIEITLSGPKLLFNKNYTISITGGNFNPLINKKSIKMFNAINVNRGDILNMGHTNDGARSYIAISGGINCESFLGSKSSYVQLTNSRLKKGDEIIISDDKTVRQLTKGKYRFNLNTSINVFKGPEFEILNDKSILKLFTKEFVIGSNNRMAYNLEDKIQTETKSILSSPVLPGTIQITPSGNIMILHRDCQTTGGYPRILQLNKESLNNLAQLKTGDKIKFKLIKNKT